MTANAKLTAWKPKMNALKVDEALVIPWTDFIGPKPKGPKEKPISDGRRSWLCTNTERGLLVKRIL